MVASCDLNSVVVAKQKELQSWQQNNVYTEVLNERQHVMSSRWVITTKKIDGHDITKSRLVPRGFEDYKVQQRQTDSPTCSKESQRLALALIAAFQWESKSMDIKTAFLQGKLLEREIFIKPSKEANTKKLWKLGKCIYGLNEASRYWYEHVKEEFLKVGMRKSNYDDALFFYKRNKQEACKGILVTHVDDFLYGGSTQFEDAIQHVRSTFIVGREAEMPLKFLGVDLQYSEGYINLNQKSYIGGIEEAVIQNKSNRSRILDSSEEREYRALLGQLNCVSSQSCPDISYEVCRLSTVLNKATVNDFLHANKVVRKLKQRQVSLKYGFLKKTYNLVAICDASYANLNDGSSQEGLIVFLNGKDGNISPLCWNSQKMKRVYQSTIAAKTMALLKASETCFWLSHIINEMLDIPLGIT